MSFWVTFRSVSLPPPKSWHCILIKLFIALSFTNAVVGQSDPSPVISSSVANHICNQQSEYQETSQIQAPLKSKPENDDSTCGWYSWTKCPDSNSEICPSFVLKTCDEIGGDKKKGRGILKKPVDVKPAPCDNSTEKGLPDPQIVPLMSKYPSVVTIERGDRCQVKHCAGLLLDKDWVVVLQAGCFFEFKPEHSDIFRIVAGERRMHVEEGTEQRRNVAEFISHPGYRPEEDGKYYVNNIGLIRVSAPFEFNENVQPIDLSAIESITPSIAKSTLKIVGWLNAQPMKEEDELLASLVESPLDFVPMDDCYDKGMEADGAPRDSLTCAGKCVLYGGSEIVPRKSILYAQESSEPESPLIPVGLGPVSHTFIPQHGVFLNLAPYIPWIKETVEGQDQGEGQGHTTESPVTRIIRGEDAPPYKYKSMVNIEVYLSYACTYHYCGGSILNEEWFLTAAHCVDEAEKDTFTIFVGDHDISDSDENEQVVKVVKIINHENYQLGKTLNDISVVKVSPPFKFNDKVQKVTLPEPSLEIKGPLTAIGWGRTENYTYLHILKEVEIPYIPLDECQKLFENNSDREPPVKTQICAGNETHGTCSADSGGPLYESGEQIVVGVVSFGGSMCWIKDKSTYDVASLEPEPTPFEPNVFTEVAPFVEWIRKNSEMDK